MECFEIEANIKNDIFNLGKIHNKVINIQPRSNKTNSSLYSPKNSCDNKNNILVIFTLNLFGIYKINPK